MRKKKKKRSKGIVGIIIGVALVVAAVVAAVIVDQATGGAISKTISKSVSKSPTESKSIDNPYGDNIESIGNPDYSGDDPVTVKKDSCRKCTQTPVVITANAKIKDVDVLSVDYIGIRKPGFSGTADILVGNQGTLDGNSHIEIKINSERFGSVAELAGEIKLDGKQQAHIEIPMIIPVDTYLVEYKKDPKIGTDGFDIIIDAKVWNDDDKWCPEGGIFVSIICKGNPIEHADDDHKTKTIHFDGLVPQTDVHGEMCIGNICI